MLKQFFIFLRSKNNFSRFCGPWRVPFSGSLFHRSGLCPPQRTEVISCKSGPLKSTLQGSQRRGKCFFDLKNFKNLLESPQVIQKQLRDSPEPIFELESHFEKSMKFAIFGNFRLQQRTDAVWCKSEPLNGTLQGP